MGTEEKPLDKFAELVEGKFTEARVQALKQAFKKFMIKIKKPKGSLEPDRMNTSDIGPLMRVLNLNPLESEIEDMMNEMDPKKEGTITFYQFLFLLWRKTLAGEEEDVLSAFQVFDTDNDGILSINDLRKILSKVGEPFNEEELHAFFLHADINETGKIDYVDFINRMNVEDTEPAGKGGKSKSRKSKKGKKK